jgi:CheY-like chemotaxis protein/HPt (histidine-containing phosphotransfer) domain-containing protein
MVMLTSLGERPDQTAMDRAGISACLLKPVKQSRLFDCLASVISGGADSGPGLPTAGTARVAAHAKGGNRKRGLQILLAEDNSVNQKVALLQLRKLGFTADTVTNGKEAVDALRRIPYDVVLMDCQMPEMDGYEAAHQIRSEEKAPAGNRESTPPTYIIAMTANVLEGDREQCRSAGMDDYITKPVQLHELQAALGRAQGRSAENRPAVRPPSQAEARPSSDALDWKLIESLRDLREAGQPDPLAELVDLFLEDAPRRLERLRDAIASKDPLAAYAAAHSLKGSASNMGARSLAAYCSTLEKQARSGNLEGADQLLHSIESELRQTSRLLEAEKKQ